MNLHSNSIAKHIATEISLRAEITMLTTSLQELKSLNTCLRDEHAALQLLFASLEDKLRKVQVVNFILIGVSCFFRSFFFLFSFTIIVLWFQEENRQLVERLIKYKAKDAEKLNEENESFLK